MNLWEAKVAEKLMSIYNIEDSERLVKLIKNNNSQKKILEELWIDWGETKTETKVTINWYKDLWMKSIYCEYSSFNPEAECKFCGRRRKDWYLKPCLYYLEQNNESNW